MTQTQRDLNRARINAQMAVTNIEAVTSPYAPHLAHPEPSLTALAAAARWCRRHAPHVVAARAQLQMHAQHF